MNRLVRRAAYQPACQQQTAGYRIIGNPRAVLMIIMNTKPQLLLVNRFHSETLDRLEQSYEIHHLWRCSSDTEKQSLIRNLEGTCKAAASASWYCDELVYTLKSLEVLACFGVGVDAINFEKTRANGIRVTNTPDVLNDAVADLALALILATSRKLINADHFVRKRDWHKGAFVFGRDLKGKTLGVIGLGRIGEAIVERALPFGMKIAYHNRKPKTGLAWDYYPGITELAVASDILLCMLPGGEQTRAIINRETFKALGPEGIFINVGRGSSVNEDDLIAALQNKTIAAAGLDVFANEPHVPEALLQLDNVVLLPHIGSATMETRRAMGQLVIDNLAAYFAGRPLLTEIG